MPLSMHPRLTLRVPAGQRRSWHRGEAARALDEESVVAVQGESSDWLWVMPGLPQAPQGAGGAGIIVLEADGGAAGAGPKGPFLGRWERAWGRPLIGGAKGPQPLKQTINRQVYGSDSTL